MFRIEIYSKHDNKSSELQELDPRKKKQQTDIKMQQVLQVKFVKIEDS